MGEIKYSNSFFRTLKETPILKYNPIRYDFDGSLVMPSSVYNMHDVWVDDLEKNKKESKEMEILKIYKEREDTKIEKEFAEKKSQIKEKDEIQSILNEFKAKIKEKINDEDRYSEIEFGDLEYVYSKETREEISKIEKEERLFHRILKHKVEEIEALMDLADNFEEKMKILENYEITKKGKLNI